MSSLATISIGGTGYGSFGSRSEARAYFATTSKADAWDALTVKVQDRGLVQGTRLLSRQSYLGIADATAIALQVAFPRSGLTDKYGQAIPATTVPVEACQANFELALLLETGETEAETSTTGPTQVRAQTDREGPFSTSVQNFFPGQDRDLSQRWPQIVQDLLGRWFAKSGAQIPAEAFGATDTTSFVAGQDGVTSRGLP